MESQISESVLSSETSSSESSQEITQASDSVEEPQTAVVNGEVVQLEPPHKEGQTEANETQAPKEELIQGNARSFRAAAASVPMYRLYNPNSGEHFYTKRPVSGITYVLSDGVMRGSAGKHQPVEILFIVYIIQTLETIITR